LFLASFRHSLFTIAASNDEFEKTPQKRVLGDKEHRKNSKSQLLSFLCVVGEPEEGMRTITKSGGDTKSRQPNLGNWEMKKGEHPWNCPLSRGHGIPTPICRPQQFPGNPGGEEMRWAPSAG
jgi:hypothetical protein